MANAEFDEIRREKLLKAALSLFVNRGFYGVAVPKIAVAAGMATGSIYRYFANKEELVNELYYYWKLQLRSMVTTDYPLDKAVEEQFSFIWNSIYEFANKNPDAFQFIEGHCHASYLDQRCHDIEEELFEIGRTFIRGGQAAGVICAGDPQLLVSMFFGAFTQFFKDAQAKRLKWNLETSLLLRDICWRGLKA